MMKHVSRTIALVAIVVLLALPSASTKASASLEPHVVGWEQIFKLEWEVTERRGEPVLRGYLLNDSPYLVAGIRLLVDGLGDTGGIQAQRVSSVGLGSMMPFSRVYFEVPTPGRHPRYQARVFTFVRVEADGGRVD